MKVLLVVDDENECSLYSKFLNDLDYETVSVNNFDSNENILNEIKPDLMLIESQINKINASEWLDYLKQNKTEIPPFILLFENLESKNKYKKGFLGEEDSLVKENLTIDEFGRVLKRIQSKIENISKISNIQNAQVDAENFFNKLFEYSNDAIFFVDKNTGLYLNANKAALDLTGLTLEEIKQKHTYDISPQGFDRIKKVKSSKETVDLGEVTYLRPNNTERIALLSAIPINENLILGIAKDITERKKYETYIKQSEITYRNILNEISELIYIQDEFGRFIDVNRAVEMIYGYSKDEFIGRTPEFLSAEGFNDLKKISQFLTDAYYGKVTNFEFWGKTKSGKVFPKEVFVYPGNYFGKKVVIAVARDVTERKVSENLLKQTIARNSAILNALPDMIFIFDNNYKVVDCSYNSNAPLLISPKEFLGKFANEVFPENLKEITIRNVDNVLTKGEVCFDYYSLEINKQIRYFESRYVKSGEKEVLAIVRDITEHKNIEFAFKENKNIFQTIIDNAPFEIWARNLDMVCILENKLLKEHWGPLLGTKPQENNINKDEFNIWTNNNKKAASGEIVNYEVDYHVKGIKKSYQNIVAPIYDNNSITGIAGFNIDITDRKRVELELIKQKEKAIESDNLKTAFLQNISHEIRTPLNGIIGFSNLLQYDDISKDEIKDYTKMIQQSGYRLIEIINNILDISKIETGQIKIDKKQFSLNSLIDDLYISYKKIAEDKEIEFKGITTLSDESSIVIGDEIKISQVLNNLLNNAFKFTINGKITFGYNIKEKDIEFFVKDTGIGIRQDDQSRIFDRFTQTDNSLSRGFEGAGLGLAICKGLVNILGGKIWLSSQYETGSEFYFTIPYYTPIDENLILKKTNSSIKQFKTILIAEDDLVSFKYLKTLLEKKNIQIIHAENGEDAIYYALNYSDIDLILMDIRMPNIDGIEATKVIKEKLPNLPIIAQTAYSFNEERKMILEAGCDDYIVKPIDKEILERILESYF